jgi:hypothetical protein
MSMLMPDGRVLLVRQHQHGWLWSISGMSDRAELLGSSPTKDKALLRAAIAWGDSTGTRLSAVLEALRSAA